MSVEFTETRHEDTAQKTESVYCRYVIAGDRDIAAGLGRLARLLEAR